MRKRGHKISKRCQSINQKDLSNIRFNKNNMKNQDDLSQRLDFKGYRRKYILKIRKRMNSDGCGPTDKKQLENKLKKYIDSKHQQLQTISISSLGCPICLDILMTPCTTICGHSFCFRCIEETLMRQAVCPVCRTLARVQELTESIYFQNVIDSFWRRSQKQRQYSVKYDENLEWLKKRRVSIDKLKPGNQIDARDTEFIWCKSQVVALYPDDSPSGPRYIKVHYLGWNKLYDEIIDINSQRIAPYNFFTYRVDIPHYQGANPNEENMRSRINYGTTTRELFDPQRRAQEQRNPGEQNNLLFLRRNNQGERDLAHTVFDLAILNNFRPRQVRGNNNPQLEYLRRRNPFLRRAQYQIVDSQSSRNNESDIHIQIQNDSSPQNIFRFLIQNENGEQVAGQNGQQNGLQNILRNIQAQQQVLEVQNQQQNNQELDQDHGTIGIQLLNRSREFQQLGQANRLFSLNPHFSSSSDQADFVLNFVTDQRNQENQGDNSEND